MHTFNHGNVTIHYNSDLSGDALIWTSRASEVRMPCAALLAFVAEYVSRERIAKLESATDAEILGTP